MDYVPTLPPKRARPGFRSSSYVLRHWRGELSLAVAYWLNGLLLANLVPLAAASALVAAQGDAGRSLQDLAALNLALVGLFIAAQVWGVTGILRSGQRHVARGGDPFWAAAAGAMVGLTLAGLVAQAIRLHLPERYLELARLAAGRDPMRPVTVELGDSGHALLVTGELGSGSAARVRAALAAAPAVRVVHLASPGGRLFEARAIAELVRERGLDTFADGACASACTIVFLAGRDRGATPQSRLGFHRASFAGLHDGVDNQEMTDLYRAAGLPETFVERVNATAPSEIWYPTREELLGSRVVTRLSLGEERLSFALAGIHSAADLDTTMRGVPMWRAIDGRYPGTIARATAVGWDVKRQGGSDADALTAMRSVLGGLVPRALETASDDLLDRFTALRTDEMREALAVSPQACNALLDGRLNTVSTLPRETIEREATLTTDLFAAAPRPEERPAADAAAAAIRLPFGRLAPALQAVVGAPETFRDRPRQRCEGLLAFQAAIAALPDTARHAALRALYQAR